MSTQEKNFAPTQPWQPQPANSALESKWPTRIIYCLALLALIMGQFGQSSWVGLATGGGLLGWVGMFVLLLIASSLVYRIYLVLRYKASLRARKPNIFGWLFRGVGWLAMLAGALGIAALLLVKPLTLLLFKSAGDNGIAFFVVGLYAVMLSSAGWLGCLLFELSRVMGTRATQPRASKTPRQRKQDLGVAASVFALVVGVPYALRLIAGEPCYGPNLTRCMASVEGGVTRPAIAPFGSSVSLETNIEELVFIKQLEPRKEVKENPAFSLLKAGHPTQGPVESAIRVALNAVAVSKGVAITLQVFDAQGESAKFVTTIPKNARLEPGKDGKQKVVLDLPSKVHWGLQFTKPDPVTKQSYILAEIFSQMRQAIFSPREAAEWSMRVTRTVREVSATDIARTSKIDEAKPSASCRDIVTLARIGDNETALRPAEGSPLNRLMFRSAADPDHYALAQVNDRIGCNGDGVWAFNYPAWNGDFEIRRYTKEGQLLNFVSTTLPIDKLQGAWADMESAKVVGNKISFSTVSIPKPGEWKRRVYEVSL